MEIGVSPLFRDVSEESQQAMRTCFDMREYSFRAGEVIYDFSEGRNMVGVLTQGAAVIERIDHQGSRTILERLERGGVFGEMLMFENVAGDSITVVAEEPCRVWLMAADQVTKRCENACAHHTQVVENMFQLVAEKATSLYERVEVLSRRSIRDKLLCYFSLLAAKSRGGEFSLPFSLSALADYISTDRSAMMRELKKMRDEKLVDIQGRRVLLHQAMQCLPKCRRVIFCGNPQDPASSRNQLLLEILSILNLLGNHLEAVPRPFFGLARNYEDLVPL